MLLLNLIIIALLFFLGAAIGSFLNVIIYRSTTGESWAKGRSHCETCSKAIPWFENIPVVSYFMLRGKSRCCKKPLSLSHPVIEGLTGALFVWWYVAGFVFFKLTTQPFVVLQPLFWLLVGLLLLYIFIYDYRYMLIPTWSVTVLFVLVVFYRLLLAATGIMQYQDLYSAIITMVVASSFFFLLWIATQKKGIGFGDVELAVPLSLLLGWPKAVVGFFLAFVLGGIVGGYLLATKKASLKRAVPFGPFLILGTLLALIWGDAIFNWYVTLITG